MAVIRQPTVEYGRTWWKPVGNAALGRCRPCKRAYAWKAGKRRRLDETHCPRCLQTLDQTTLALIGVWFSLDEPTQALTGYSLDPRVKRGEIDPWHLTEQQALSGTVHDLQERVAGDERFARALWDGEDGKGHALRSLQRSIERLAEAQTKLDALGGSVLEVRS